MLIDYKSCQSKQACQTAFKTQERKSVVRGDFLGSSRFPPTCWDLQDPCMESPFTARSGHTKLMFPERLKKVLQEPKLNGFSSKLLNELFRNYSEALNLHENSMQAGFCLCAAPCWIRTQDWWFVQAFPMKWSSLRKHRLNMKYFKILRLPALDTKSFTGLIISSIKTCSWVNDQDKPGSQSGLPFHCSSSELKQQCRYTNIFVTEWCCRQSYGEAGRWQHSAFKRHQFQRKFFLKLFCS